MRTSAPGPCQTGENGRWRRSSLDLGGGKVRPGPTREGSAGVLGDPKIGLKPFFTAFDRTQKGSGGTWGGIRSTHRPSPPPPGEGCRPRREGWSGTQGNMGLRRATAGATIGRLCKTNEIAIFLKIKKGKTEETEFLHCKNQS